MARSRPLFSFWPVVSPFSKKDKRKKEVDNSFFSFRLKSAFVSLYYRLSLAARQPLVSSSSIRQSLPPVFVFYFQIQAFRIFNLKFKGILE